MEATVRKGPIERSSLAFKVGFDAKKARQRGESRKRTQGRVDRKALSAIANHIEYTLFEYNFPEGINFLTTQNDIIRAVESFLGDPDSDLRKLLKLDKRTLNTLSRWIPGFSDKIKQIKNTPDLPDFILQDIQLWIEEETRKAGWEGEPDTENPYYNKLRNKVLKDLKKHLPVIDKYLDTLIDKKRKEWPPKWITSNRKIMENLHRKGNRHFLDLYGLLQNMRIPAKDTDDMLERLDVEFDKTPVLVLVNYERIKKETRLDYQQTRLYIREMVRHGLLVEVGKLKHGQTVYGIGYWTKGNARFPRPVYYLKNTPQIRGILKNFDALYSRKKTGQGRL